MALTLPKIEPKRLLDGLSSLASRWNDHAAAWDPGRLPLLKRLPADKRQPLLASVLLASLLIAIGGAIWHTRMTSNQAAWIGIATELQMHSQRSSKTAQQAVLGNPGAFKQLQESRDAIEKGLNLLTTGGEEVAASPAAIQAHIALLKQRWEPTRKNIEVLLSQREALVSLNRALALINARNAELSDLSQQLVALLPADARRHTSYAQQQALWTERMAKNANSIFSGDLVDPEAAYQLGEDLRTFQEVLEALLNGSASLNVVAVSDPVARDKLLELKEVFDGFRTQVESILRQLAQLSQAKRAAREIFTESETLLNLSQRLADAYRAHYGGAMLYAVLLFGLLALASLILLGAINVADARRRAEESARENKRNQDAILRLLNEMGDLAEGDLTVKATVTEDITGAIADSVNYAIDELRMLVNNINRATTQVTEATDAAKQISDQLLATAERQSQQIAATSEALNHMSQSIAGVAQNAADSSHVAELSLATARKGGDSVRNAIAGMNQLRDQIQETAKRIKRLGESSQEIGEIVELIGDITEQTNVLALNAAIQAAAAGEAGRGFSVVAEEVQRLAERSANATRRIGAIVKAIQGDTQDAVNAMEVSTQGVVEGTVLSDAAGHALQEIESVSAQLASLIQNISDATREQARTAEDIARNMQEILQATRLTSDGARRSAQSMDQLSALADELKVSVAGFKL